MQARWLLNYRLEYCWPKVFYCLCQPNELEREIKKKVGGKQKSGGAMAHPAPHLKSTLIMVPCSNISGHKPSKGVRLVAEPT